MTTEAPVALTAKEYQCIICALAGNFPERFGPIRMNLLRKLTKAEGALASREENNDGTR